MGSSRHADAPRNRLMDSPDDNIKAVMYPAMLVQISLNDSQLPYREGAMFVAKLRATNTSESAVAEDQHGRRARRRVRAV